MSRKENLRVLRRLEDKEYDYFCWIQENEKKTKKTGLSGPLFSIVLFEGNATKSQKARCLKSIKRQGYRNIQQVTVDTVNIKWKDIKEQLTGGYVLFVSMTDYLASNALVSFAEEIEKHPDAHWIYSDEDTYREVDKKRVLPHFKPKWSYDTFLSFFYTGNAAVYKVDVCEEIGDWSSKNYINWEYDFALRFLEHCNQEKIYHIPRVLYHISSDRNMTFKENIKVIKEDYLHRLGIDAIVEKEERTEEYRVVYSAKGFVSIIIPSKDNVEMLLHGITSVEKNTRYKEYEIIVVDNGSNQENKSFLEAELGKKNITYLYEPMEFNFSRMCNIGAKNARGEFLLFLNDDIECVDERWLERMVGQAMQPGVGAVGAKLLYPGGKLIQHVGVINLNMGPSHVLTKLEDVGILGQGRNCLDYNYEAVTAACLVVKKSIYENVGGFDERLSVSYNDIDFCYKLKEKGFRNVVRTDVVLIHHESISRGLDVINDEKMQRLARERTYLYEEHSWISKHVDRAYNVNYSMNQTDFSLKEQRNTNVHNNRIRRKIYANKPFNVIIDRIVREQDCYINGWYWFRNDKYTNLSDVYLVFWNEQTNEKFWYETHKHERKDVVDVVKNEAIFCGFVCRIPNNQVEMLSNCRIGLCIQIYNWKINLMTWTDKYID